VTAPVDDIIANVAKPVTDTVAHVTKPVSDTTATPAIGAVTHAPVVVVAAATDTGALNVDAVKATARAQAWRCGAPCPSLDSCGAGAGGARRW
jgi:hypothetical protein